MFGLYTKKGQQTVFGPTLQGCSGTEQDVTADQQVTYRALPQLTLQLLQYCKAHSMSHLRLLSKKQGANRLGFREERE